MRIPEMHQAIDLIFPEKSQKKQEFIPQPVGWWKHNEGSGIVLHDYQQGYDGTIYGENFWIYTAPDGSPIGAYDGDNANVVRNIGYQPILYSQISIIAAIYLNAYPAYSPCIIVRSKGYMTPLLNYRLTVCGPGGDQGKLVFVYRPAGGEMIQTYQSNMSFQLDTWYIVGLRYVYGNGGSIQMYNAGQPISGSWISGTTGNFPVVQTADAFLRIGANINTDTDDGQQISWWWFGRLGDIQLYPKALSSSAMRRKYNSLRLRYNLN